MWVIKEVVLGEGHKGNAVVVWRKEDGFYSIHQESPDPHGEQNRKSVGSANLWEAPVPRPNTGHLSTGFSDLTTLEIGDFSSPKKATPALDLQTARPKTGLLF